MLMALSEELLLRRALDRRLISSEDVATAAANANHDAKSRFGPRIDVLIRAGLLSEKLVEELHAELSARDNRAIETAATLEHVAPTDSQASEVVSAPQPLGMAATLDDVVAEASRSVSLSHHSFPVPNWDKYEFLALLGRGGMGALYRARDRQLDRIVALKFIHGDNPTQIHRFMQEARAQARLDHPNICKVYEVGLVEGKPYIAMQLVHGLPLDRAGQAMSITEKVQVMKDVSEAMHSAHEQGIIHRDLKPSNILVSRDPDGQGTLHYSPVVMDFGLARDTEASQGLTESGDVLGTPAYMSPEQARGQARRLDRRTDVYGLGATFYDLLVGKAPFEDETVVNIILKVINDAPLPLRSHDPQLPEALELIVSKCMNKEAEQRYPTAKALAEDLGRFLVAGRVEAKRLGYGYRLSYFARRNKALALLGVALLASLIGLTGFGIYTRIVGLQKDRQAKKDAELAKRLGQSVKDLEWLVRTAYLLPLHDTGREKRIVRERMREITSELGSVGSASAERLGAYVLGRGHLALHEWDAAQKQLRRAEALGYADPELDYALGRVLGELYSRAIEEARKSGDASFFHKRRIELEQELLIPARSYLKNSRRLPTVSTSYIEALIDFYDHHYDAALLNAHMAQQQEPWLYEAAKLRGDVHMARALDARDHGDTTQAEQRFADAVASYEEATAIGHSDHQVHEAIAEAWIRQEEMDMYRGANPEPKMQRALAAADLAIEAAPQDSYGYTKKASAYFFLAFFLRNQQKIGDAIKISNRLISSAQDAILRHSDDSFAQDILGNGYMLLGVLKQATGEISRTTLKIAISHFEKALIINSKFTWGFNDLGLAHWALSESAAATMEEAEAELVAAIQSFSRAVKIDPEYLNALISLSAAYQGLAELFAEHGRDPIANVRASIDAADSGLRIKKDDPSGLGNMALAHFRQATYLVYLKQNPSSSLDNAENNVRKSIYANGKNGNSFLLLAYINLLRIRWAQQESDHYDKASKEGIENSKTCLALEPDNSECKSLRALLLAASVIGQDSKIDSITYQQAIDAISSIRLQVEGNRAVLLNYAAFFCDIVEWKSARNQAVGFEVESGIKALDRLDQLTKNFPVAWAHRGALLIFASRQQRDPAKKAAGLLQAKEFFAKAFQGNPLLRNRYGRLAAEAAGQPD